MFENKFQENEQIRVKKKNTKNTKNNLNKVEIRRRKN